jgi:hypothetical protein
MNRFKQFMIVLAVFCVIEAVLILTYPLTHTQTDTLTIEAIEIWGDKRYHIMTESVILNVTEYLYDDLLVNHTYSIKWVDGLWRDWILEIEEVN